MMNVIWPAVGKGTDKRPGDAAGRLNEADSESGRTWDRTRDLPRVERAIAMFSEEFGRR